MPIAQAIQCVPNESPPMATIAAHTPYVRPSRTTEARSVTVKGLPRSFYVWHYGNRFLGSSGVRDLYGRAFRKQLAVRAAGQHERAGLPAGIFLRRGPAPHDGPGIS